MTRKPTTRSLRRALVVAAVATAVAAPAADARLTAAGPDDSYPDGWRKATEPIRPDDRADRSITAGTPTYVYADGVLRRTDGTSLSSPVAKADPRFQRVGGTVRAIDGTPISALLGDGRYVYADGVLRRTDGTPLSSPSFDGRYVYADGVLRSVDGKPLSSPAVEPRELLTGPGPTVDWRDASFGALAGFAAALLLGGALVLGRSRATARVAHP